MPAPRPRNRQSAYLAATLACALLISCAQPERAPEPAPEPAPSPPSATDSEPTAPSSSGDVAISAQQRQRGLISLYGNKFAGRKTASGETFDPTALVMAHRTLPFGTRVRVTNLENQRSVEVVVKDRGPFVSGRIADLSETAARRIGMVDGVVEALLEVLQPVKVR